MRHPSANAVAPFLLQLRWAVPAERREAFEQWYNDEHLADMASVPGILLARRFVRDASYPFATPEGADHLTLYEVSGLEAFDSPQYLGMVKTPSEQTLEVTRGLEVTRTVYRQFHPQNGMITSAGPQMASTQQDGNSLLHVMTGSAPEVDDDFHRWYNEEHLPLVVGVNGVLSGRRFVTTDDNTVLRGGPGPLRYLALYELAQPEAASSQQMLESGRPTPWRARLGNRVQSHVQVYREVARLEGTMPA